MKQELIKIGRRCGLRDLHIRYIRISRHEAGYYITYGEKYVWSDNCFLISSKKGNALKRKFIHQCRQMIQTFAAKNFELQKIREVKINRLFR
jgi:hypothetical protein